MKTISTLHYTTRLGETFVVEAWNTKKSIKYREILKLGQVKEVALLTSIKQNQHYLLYL